MAKWQNNPQQNNLSENETALISKFKHNKRLKRKAKKSAHTNSDHSAKQEQSLDKNHEAFQRKKRKKRRSQKKHLLVENDRTVHVSGTSYDEDESENGWIMVTSRKQKSNIIPSDTKKQNIMSEMVESNGSNSSIDLIGTNKLINEVETLDNNEPPGIGESKIVTNEQRGGKQNAVKAQARKHDIFKPGSMDRLSADRLSRASSGYSSDSPSLPLEEAKPVLLRPSKLKRIRERAAFSAPEIQNTLQLDSAIFGDKAHQKPLVPVPSKNDAHHSTNREIPLGAINCSKEVDERGTTIDLHECKLKIAPGALSTPTTITVDRWNRPEACDNDSMVITPTIQCEPSGLTFTKPVKFSLPVCYMPKDRAIDVQVEVSYDNVTWEKMCVHCLAPGNRRVVEFDSNHFCRYRVRAVGRDNVQQLQKYVRSIGFLKRNWCCSNPDCYTLVWCIHDDDPALNDKVLKEMRNDETCCYDRLIEPNTFCIEVGSEIHLQITCSELQTIIPDQKKAMNLNHEMNRKFMFILHKKVMLPEHKHFTLKLLVSVIDAYGNSTPKLDEYAYLEWDKNLERITPTSPPGMLVNTMHQTVSRGAAGFSINQQTSHASGATTSPASYNDDESFFTGDDTTPAHDLSAVQQTNPNPILTTPLKTAERNLPNGSISQTPPSEHSVTPRPQQAVAQKKKKNKKEKINRDQSKVQDDVTSSSSSLPPPPAGGRKRKKSLKNLFRRSKATQ